jgi:hypothetical protein
MLKQTSLTKFECILPRLHQLKMPKIDEVSVNKSLRYFKYFSSFKHPNIISLWRSRIYLEEKINLNNENLQIPKAYTFTKKSPVICMLIRWDDVMKLRDRIENDRTGRYRLSVHWRDATSVHWMQCNTWQRANDLKWIICKSQGSWWGHLWTTLYVWEIVRPETIRVTWVSHFNFLPGAHGEEVLYFLVK